MDIGTVVGLVAAACTTLSYVPQLKKCWETGSAGDLSLRMFLILATGVALWIGYGILRGDWVIIVANAVSLLLLSGILWFKLRPRISGQAEEQQPPAASHTVGRSEDRYHAVLESTRDYAIFTTDCAGRILDWYPGAAAVFGWSSEKIVGQPARCFSCRRTAPPGPPAANWRRRRPRVWRRTSDGTCTRTADASSSTARSCRSSGCMDRKAS